MHYGHEFYMRQEVDNHYTVDIGCAIISYDLCMCKRKVITLLGLFFEPYFTTYIWVA